MRLIICISIFWILRTSLSVFADTPQKVSRDDWSCSRLTPSQHYTDGLRGRKDRGEPLLLYRSLHALSSTAESDAMIWTQQSLHSIAYRSFQLSLERRECLAFSFLLIEAFWHKLRSNERSEKCQHRLAKLTTGRVKYPRVHTVSAKWAGEKHNRADGSSQIIKKTGIYRHLVGDNDVPVLPPPSGQQAVRQEAASE